jgi:DNA-binding transcriptional regulator YhcF (GntR family)
VIQFRLDMGSGVPPYLQIVRQVEHAVRLGLLQTGDRLPTVKEIAVSLALNPNTVLKAYRELDHRGLTVGKVGSGTFIQSSRRIVSPAQLKLLRRSLHNWMRGARAARLTDEDVDAFVEDAKKDIPEQDGEVLRHKSGDR